MIDSVNFQFKVSFLHEAVIPFIFCYGYFISCFSADRIKMSARKYYCLIISVYKNMDKTLLIAIFIIKNAFKQVSRAILSVYVVLLTTFYQKEDECRVCCARFIVCVHTILSSNFIGLSFGHRRCSIFPLNHLCVFFFWIFTSFDSLSYQLICHNSHVLNYY